MATVYIPDQTTVETDVLVIGGGLAGCFAAIKARENGAKVTVFDKAAIRRSGNATHGMDHLPIIASPGLTISPEELAERAMEGMMGLTDPGLSYILAEEGIKRALDLHDYGVEVLQPDGTLLFVPGRYELGKGKEAKWSMIFLRGGDMKMKLASQVRRRGCRVIERTVGTKLLTNNGRVVGATGVNVRTGEFLICKAKAIVLCTGSAHRLYWQPEGLMANYYCPTNCGDGHALAYRAGVRLTGMEFIQVQTHTKDYPAGPRPHGFYAIMANERGENIQKKYEHVGNILAAHALAALEEEEAGRIAYWNTDEMSKEARDMWALGMANEHAIALKFTRERGMHLTKERLEARIRVFGLYRSISGPIVDEHMQTSLHGLFGGGDNINSSGMGGCTNAFVTGARAGHFAAKYAQETEEPLIRPEQVEEEKARVYACYGRENGIKPLQLEDAVRRIVHRYVGIKKSGPKLQRGLELLQDVRDAFMPQVVASTPHELLRYLELQNIMDVAEILFRTSLVREESRMFPAHWRLDFPEEDDTHWQKAIVVQKAGQGMELNAESPDQWMRRS